MSKTDKASKLSLKGLLFDSIENDEEFAITLIDNSQRFKLSFSEANDENETPLIFACYHSNAIAKAILGQGTLQDIAINARNNRGCTAFILACKSDRVSDSDLTSIVAKMLEIAQEIELDLNTKDNEGKTGFIRACEEKNPEIVNLLVDKAEDLNIDLQAKDGDGMTAFM